jgi:hypothetical protein
MSNNTYGFGFCGWCGSETHNSAGSCMNPFCPGKKPKEDVPPPINPIVPSYHNYGWLCPACGRGNAPFTQTCPCRPYPKYEVWC